MELEPIELPTEASAPSASAPSAPGTSSTSNSNANPFDLETYISRYESNSETRLQRLLLIGSQLTGQSTSDEAARTAAQAYRLAERHCRDTANVRTYRQVFGGGQAAAAAARTMSSGGAGGGGLPSAGSGSGEAAAGDEESAAATMMIPPELLEGNNNTSTNSTTLPAAMPHCPGKYGLSFDATFATTTDHTSQMHLQTLEARLSQAQAHLAKDAIRTAYLALAEHHRLRGDLREALRKVLRSRDFCTSTRQSGAVCLLVIELGVDLRNFALVNDYVAKAEHTTDLLHTDPLFAARLRAAAGLAHLHEGRYAEAARKFATVQSDLTAQFATVLSAEDLALYGSLLGMAALDRSELQDLVLDSASFQSRLELVPAMREALRHYARAEYGPALSVLSARVRPHLDLDLHLRPHAEALLRRIRDRCAVQYFAPYSRVGLATMAGCFAVPPPEMEAVVAGLVRRGKIRGGARINAAEQTLVADAADRCRRRRRVRTKRRVARLGRTFVDEAEGMLLRLSCVESGLVVSSEGRSGRGGGGGFGGGGGGGGGMWGAGGDGGRRGGRSGRSGRGGGRQQQQPALGGVLGGMMMGDAGAGLGGGGGGGADAAMMMAYGIDDDSSSSDGDGGHGGDGEPGMEDVGDDEMMDVDDGYANPEGGI